MKRAFFLILILTNTFLIGCRNENKITYEDGLGNFDVNPNGNQLLFSYMKKGVSSLYKASIDGTNVSAFIKLADSIVLYNPRYSHNGEKIIFLSSKKDSSNSSLWMINVDGSNLTQLVKAEGIITEAVFSVDYNFIYYGKAAAYENHSPLVTKAAHGFDVYRIDLKDQQVKKVTNLDSYQLSNISDVDNEKLIFGQATKGVSFYNKKTGIVLEKFWAKNNKERDPNSYSNPIIINEKLASLVSYYQLVVYDLDKREEKIIFNTLDHSSNQFGVVRLMKKRSRLLFSYSDNSPVLYSISLEGKGLQEVKLLMDK